ncbi:MAG: M23 family metallopeptidase [Erysipelotrichaceae bacterium]
MNRNKKLILIFFSAFISICISYLFPSNIGKSLTIDSVAIKEEKAYISQAISSISLQPTKITKVYDSGTLIGVLYDQDILEQQLQKQQQQLAGTDFEGYTVSLDQKIYTITENSCWNFENKDQEIIQYLIDNELFVIKAYQIDIYGSDQQLKDTLYVKSIDDFSEALKRFVLCFTDENTYVKLSNHENIIDLSTYGQQDVNVYLEETIKAQEVGVNVDDVYSNADDIFHYLCYGRDTELTYYTVEEYETIAAVARNHSMTSTQLVSINESLDDINQPIVAGQQLNVTYFDSPLNVVVEQQRYVKEVTYPENSVYTFDEKLAVGEIVEDVAPKEGYNDAMYTDIYVNGVISGYRQEFVKVVEEPTVGQYRYNNASFDDRGIFFSLPCNNPYIYCDYYGYAGHNGCDFIDLYNPYGPVLACCDCTIIEKGYESRMGNYYYVDCSKGIIMRYLHMNVPGYYNVGDSVLRGTVIGQIGNTGVGSGPHVDVGVYIDGVQVDPCTVLPCEQAGRR